MRHIVRLLSVAFLLNLIWDLIICYNTSSTAFGLLLYRAFTISPYRLSDAMLNKAYIALCVVAISCGIALTVVSFVATRKRG